MQVNAQLAKPSSRKFLMSMTAWRPYSTVLPCSTSAAWSFMWSQNGNHPIHYEPASMVSCAIYAWDSNSFAHIGVAPSSYWTRTCFQKLEIAGRTDKISCIINDDSPRIIHVSWGKEISDMSPVYVLIIVKTQYMVVLYACRYLKQRPVVELI